MPSRKRAREPDANSADVSSRSDHRGDDAQRRPKARRTVAAPDHTLSAERSSSETLLSSLTSPRKSSPHASESSACLPRRKTSSPCDILHKSSSPSVSSSAAHSLASPNSTSSSSSESDCDDAYHSLPQAQSSPPRESFVPRCRFPPKPSFRLLSPALSGTSDAGQPGLLDRLRAFLPKMRRANGELEQRIKEGERVDGFEIVGPSDPGGGGEGGGGGGGGGKRQDRLRQRGATQPADDTNWLGGECDSDDEGSDINADEAYIEMNLGLGVLEERARDDGDVDTPSSDDDDGDEERTVMDKLLGRREKLAAPVIEELSCD